MSLFFYKLEKYQLKYITYGPDLGTQTTTFVMFVVVGGGGGGDDAIAAFVVYRLSRGTNCNFCSRRVSCSLSKSLSRLFICITAQSVS